mmetsp:Transcript_18356/g.24549  ORF Transcript_18356/g.24549 Transcript_18356/m.24549 type:complete len:133 (+) Transcript_18356:1589-1987(+)
MEMEEMQILDSDFNVLCLEHKMFPIVEWERAITGYVQQCPGHLHQKAFETLSDIVKKCIYSHKLFTQEMIPNIVNLFQSVINKTDQQSDMLKWYVGDVFEQLKGQMPSEFESRLREYFKKWVELSQIDDPVA